jgi:hypothetical protein
LFVAVDVKFDVTLREEQNREGNILVKEGTNNVRFHDLYPSANVRMMN